MNILLLHNYYRSNQVGGEDVVFQAERRALEEALGKEHVWTYTVSNDDVRPLKLLKTIWGDRKHAAEVRRLVDKHQIDIVHVHNFFPILTPSIFKAAKESGAFVIQTLHNYRWWCLPGTLYHEKRGPCRACSKTKWFWPAIMGRCYGSSTLQSIMGALALSWYRWRGVDQFIDAYWALSHTQMNTLKQLGVSASRLVYKPNFVEGLDIPFSLSSSGALLSPSSQSSCISSYTADARDSAPTRKPDGYGYSDRVQASEKRGYVFVGRLEVAKGISLLLEAWAQSGIKESLIIIGAGPLLKALKTQYEGNQITFLGMCSHVETLQYMASARYVFQLSLMEETFGLTMIEAMQLGTPVIGLRIGTRAEMIEQGVNGWLATPENLALVIRKSADCLENWYARLSENAIKRASVFEKSRVLERQIELYRQSLRGAPPNPFL